MEPRRAVASTFSHAFHYQTSNSDGANVQIPPSKAISESSRHRAQDWSGIPLDCAAIKWLRRHAASCLGAKNQIRGKTNRNSYFDRETESMCILLQTNGPPSKAEARSVDYCWQGIRTQTDEHIIAAETDSVRCCSMPRRPEGDMWDRTALLTLTSTPWNLREVTHGHTTLNRTAPNTK